MAKGLISFQLDERFSGRGLDIGARMKDGLSRLASRRVAWAMRNGVGGLRDQFRIQAEATSSGYKPWKKTKQFGIRKPPAQTLQRSGALRSAWLGGIGSITDAEKRRVAVSVDTKRFIRAAVFMGKTDAITRPIKYRGMSSHQRYFLGTHFHVWISEKRLKKGLRIPPRRLGIGPDMLRTLRTVITDYFVYGDADVGRLPGNFPGGRIPAGRRVRFPGS
jgi:hypothetical protein